MTSPSGKRLLFIILVLLLVAQSCAQTKTGRVGPKSHARTQSAQVRKPPQAPVQVTISSVGQARKSMDAGEYQKAIELYGDECRKQPQDQALEKEFVKGLEGIKAKAANALAKGDYAAAGRLFYTLQTSTARYSAVAQKLSFSPAYVSASLSHCKKSLSVQGFQEYRNGNLDRAIELWQSLLAIDPDNREIREAVRTAKVQQKNLQEKK